MNTPADKRIMFTLYSHPMKDMKMRWKATLTFLPGSNDDSFAEIRMADGEGTAVTDAAFEFAGTTTVIKDGIGQLRCGDFASGKHEPAIWLHRHGVPPVPGALTFE